jgi:hypothetical protein
MHRHSRESFVHGGKKGDDRIPIVLQHPVQRKRRVFPAAPAKYDPFAHGWSFVKGILAAGGYCLPEDNNASGGGIDTTNDG